jgi:hypothetical protein
MKEIYVTNKRGEKEPFSFKKLYQGVRNCGASKEVALEIASQIQKEIFPGISTQAIYQRAFELLLERSPKSAIKFNLKSAIEKLGPTGFPFEKFVARIFEAKGFEVKVNQIIPGFCIQYEIDFVAKKEKLVYIGECKFHSIPGGRVDLQVALSNFARFLDIKNGKFLNSNLEYKSILVTNTKFTQEAISYSKCVGVELLGWKYPQGGGLEKEIEENKLFPVTILPSVSSELGKILIENKIVLVRDVFSPEFEKLKIKDKERVLKEAKILLEENYEL